MKSTWSNGILILITLGCFSCSDENALNEDSALTNMPVVSSRYESIKMKEDVVTNLELCYFNSDFENYEKLFHLEYEHISGGRKSTRERELIKMRNMFDSGIKFQMDFSEGEWRELPSYEGRDCVDCWETIRIVEKTLITAEGNKGGASDHYRIIIAPVKDGEVNKYKIYKTIHIRDEDFESVLANWKD